MTCRKIRAILQLRQKSRNVAFLPIKNKYFVIEKSNLQKKSHTPYTSKYIKAYNNYTTSPSYSNQGERSDVWDTKLFIPGKYNADIKAIIDNAGVKNQSLWAKLPKGKAVCEYDKFYNIINETTNVPEPVFVTQYLKKSIFELESIIDLAKADESISEDKVNNLEKLLAESYEFLSKRDNSREKIIEYRINLKNSITKILK